MVAIEFAAGALARKPGGIDHTHTAGTVTEQPEAIAANMIHVRVDDGNGRRHGDHRLERVGALAEDVASGFRGSVMRRSNDAAVMSGRMKFHEAEIACVRCKHQGPAALIPSTARKG